jgi:hypothetical protein
MNFKKKILHLFDVESEAQLKQSDRLLVKHLLKQLHQKQSGGGYSIRPDLGEIAGMVQRTGYVDRFPPVFVGQLLDNVAFQLRGSV